jgi:hypothetical protein
MIDAARQMLLPQWMRIFSKVAKLGQVLLMLSLVLGAGCKYSASIFHKQDEAKSDAKPNPTPVMTGSMTNASGLKLSKCDLGAILMTNRSETCVALGEGRQCHLTPVMVDKHNIQLTVTVESKKPNGRIHDLSIAQVVAATGQSLEVAVGDFNFSLTPEVVSP